MCYIFITHGNCNESAKAESCLENYHWLYLQRLLRKELIINFFSVSWSEMFLYFGSREKSPKIIDVFKMKVWIILISIKKLLSHNTGLFFGVYSKGLVITFVRLSHIFHIYFFLSDFYLPFFRSPFLGLFTSLYTFLTSCYKIWKYSILNWAPIAVEGRSVAGKMNAGRTNLRGTKVNFCAVLVLLCCVLPRTPAQRPALHYNFFFCLMLLTVPLYRRLWI